MKIYLDYFFSDKHLKVKREKLFLIWILLFLDSD